MPKLFIKECRQKKGYSLNELALLSGISKGHLSDIENGKKVPGIETLCKIAIALKEDISNLFEC